MLYYQTLSNQYCNGKGESVVFDKGCYTITSLLFLIKYNTHHSQYPILTVMVVFTLIPIVQCEWRIRDCDWWKQNRLLFEQS